MDNGFITPGYEDMQLSTQMVIAEALIRGLEVEVLDRLKHFICIKKNNHFEFIKEATVTSKDSAVCYFITANKELTKLLLSEVGLHVPKGRSFSDSRKAKKDFDHFASYKVVVKPNSLGMGRGITVLSKNSARELYEKAIHTAFAVDSRILIEEFLEGIECRFLVIDGRCVGVMHRTPANVVGDGQRTIADLVKIKNSDPRRGKGHITPLEKIELGVVEQQVLLKQNLTPDSIIPKGEKIFLRDNSNISTGGDSIDYTDIVHEDYKRIAEEAVKAVQASICGVDLILKHPGQAASAETYGILELNHNPVLYFHDFPFEGKNRKVARYVLDLLGF
jgi:glutamate--cysteine ligase